MKRRYSRRNPGDSDLNPELKALRRQAAKLAFRSGILRRGAALALTAEDVTPEEFEACTDALDEALKADCEAEGMRLTIRAAQRASDEAEDTAGEARGQVQ